MINPDRQRDFAADVAARLRAAGYQALWAGGCVRDALLGKTPKDYDVATSATPDQVRQVFGKQRTIAIGAAFGVITVKGRRGAGQIEVATFRKDVGYSDGRRPDRVEFTDAEQDARRRDFTINGMFYDPADDHVIDYVGGAEDLAARVVRAIGDPEARFDEDKLRMLRAVRFAATLDFEIEADTFAAISRHAEELSAVSAERVAAELVRMLACPGRRRALELLAQCGLLEHVLPEFAGRPEAEREVAMWTLDRLDWPSTAAALAVLTWGALPRVVAEMTQRLRLSNALAAAVGWMNANADALAAAEDLSWPQLQPLLIAPEAGTLIDLIEARAGGPTAGTLVCREKLALPPEELNPAPLLDGTDLIEAGIAAGPTVGRLLRVVREAQLEGTIATRDDAIALALAAAGRG
ncbi:tRNA nucleotidyltransferase/poly(A) polymerase [Pirellulimonas nuda]|uniref:tRNA nucleotidyltransferase/poly(A) polymerase n=1 Tax=Pirellulimonas nuda TaxID=2528009 RepID=A0A518DEJ2_9BACT|nr:CCA tRNA nucleotidyltransferase [Pirellulimonas nuda]QDU89887.1 tRNA nucleotidyltransferase/poly(A) polymerase [Pirellulimonas nuda]